MSPTAWIVIGVAIVSITEALLGYLMVRSWAKDEQRRDREQPFEPRYKMGAVKESKR